MSRLLLLFRIGFFLAVRQVRRSSIWTNVLIIFIMLLTFLNLVVVTGILVGLVKGINDQYRVQYTGDVIISALDSKNYIAHSNDVLGFVRSLPQVTAISARYKTGGSVEANYWKHTSPNDKPEKTGAQIFGIDPVVENKLTGLGNHIVEGEYLVPGDYDKIVIGDMLLDRYSFGQQSSGQTPLTDVYPGSKVRVTIGDITREMTVKGIVKSKVSPIADGVFITDVQLRSLIGRTDQNFEQIALRLDPEADPAEVRDVLKKSGVSTDAKVQTFSDAIPKGVADITDTFSMIGNFISSIGLVVASVTIFIVIFINAITRRKFIGILKGIGVDGRAIVLAYIFQSLFYATIGSILGLLVLYGVLVPYVSAHPIDFPFSDGVLYAPWSDTLWRIALLVGATALAGFVPARIIVRKNTLDSILGRN